MVVQLVRDVEGIGDGAQVAAEEGDGHGRRGDGQ